jgi:hypothetical protein
MMLAALTVIMMACSKDEPFDDSATLNPEDTRLEILATPVWRYYGGAGDHYIQKITYTMRDASCYFISPLTEERDEELAKMAEENLEVDNPLIVRCANEGYLVYADRSFITSSDYVSDRYFDGYYYGDGGDEPTLDFTIILQTIIIKPEDGIDAEALKNKLVKKYGKKINKETARIEHRGNSYLIYLDSRVNTSAQVLDISNEIYMRDDVKWSEPNMFIPLHLCD